jgi:hypothetical protein
VQRVEVRELKAGDRFVEEPPPWYGEGRLLSISDAAFDQEFQQRYGHLGLGPLLRLEFEAPVQEPPGLLYLSPTHHVLRLEPQEPLVRGPWERPDQRHYQARGRAEDERA